MISHIYHTLCAILVATVAENAEAAAARNSNPLSNPKSLLQLQLEKIAGLSEELRSQQEKINLSKELGKLFEKFANDKQFSDILPPSIIYDIKGRPKNTTREKTALERKEEEIKNSQKNQKDKKTKQKHTKKPQKNPTKKNKQALKILAYLFLKG